MREQYIQLDTLEERVITAMVTPFDANGRLNRDGAQELANYLVTHGSDGLVLAGTTGESPTLLAQDQLELFDVVRAAVGSEVLLMGGTGSNSTAEAVEMTAEADRRGNLDGILAVSPYYNRPSQYGIGHYYRALRSVTELPITLYNIPVRTGRAVDIDTIRGLVEADAISGLKDATGNIDMAARLHTEYGEDLSIYSGDDSLNLEFVRAGAIGAISVASHWAGNQIGGMFDAHFSGNDAEAERLHELLGESFRFESTHQDDQDRFHDTPNPIPTKVMMGLILGEAVVGRCLSPMVASPSEMQYLTQQAAMILSKLD